MSNTTMVALKYRVFIEPDEDGMFVAEVPSLPGCISQGETYESALKNIREAIELYLDGLRKHGESVPPGVSEVVVEV